MPNPQIKAPFDSALSALNASMEPATRQALWQDIVTRYSEPQRAYHTLDHLDQLFGHFERIYHDLHQPHLTALALYYHDVVYDPARDDNEVKSADHAVCALKPYLTQGQCARIDALINMTADHQLDNKNDTDAAYLLDLDLSILGADWEDYKQYAQAVRAEYAHIHDTDYRCGRIKALKGLLAHDRLYLTPKFAPLENRARENMAREINRLRSS